MRKYTTRIISAYIKVFYMLMAIIIVSLVLNDRKVVNVEHTNQVLTNKKCNEDLLFLERGPNQGAICIFIVVCVLIWPLILENCLDDVHTYIFMTWVENPLNGMTLSDKNVHFNSRFVFCHIPTCVSSWNCNILIVNDVVFYNDKPTFKMIRPEIVTFIN